MQPTFADLGVSAPVAEALQRRDILSPFAVQRTVIPDVLAGHDVLVQSPTGSGKTLAFGVPLVDSIADGDDGRGPFGLVLAPTRELATQIVEELSGAAQARDLNITAVYGGVGIQPQIKRARRADILVATPGRLEDLLERRAVRLDEVEILVLDEADRMLDLGFKPAVDRIVKLTPKSRQTLLFSATLEGEIDRIAKAYTRDARRHEHLPTPEVRGTVEHRFVKLAHDDKTDTLVEHLRDADRGRTLVFVRTKRGADRLVKKLTRQHDLAAVAMHGDKSQSQRERALAHFEQGKVDTLVATDVAARGIDVAGITHVINFDAPQGTDDYVHRIGRTARAGGNGIGITYVVSEQAGDMAKMVAPLGLHAELEAAGLSSSRGGGGTPHARGGAPARGGRPRRGNRGARRR